MHEKEDENKSIEQKEVLVEGEEEIQSVQEQRKQGFK